MAKKNKKSDYKQFVELGIVGVAAVFSIVIIIVLALNMTINVLVPYSTDTPQDCLSFCNARFVQGSQEWTGCRQGCLPTS